MGDGGPDAEARAIVEYASGRERIFGIGDVLAVGVVVTRIGEDRVVLHVDGRPVILRLGHGGGLRTPRGLPTPPGRRPATWIRRDRR